jgi:hypothetical protein
LIVFTNLKSTSLFTALICIAVISATSRASAVTAEAAKKCAALASKAYPPVVPGNPAAGITKGTLQDRQNYYQKCLANEGKTDSGEGMQGK